MLITIIFYSSIHPAYYEGENRIGEPPWRLCYTDGGGIGPSGVRERLLDEVIRLAEAMHDKNPFGEVPEASARKPQVSSARANSTAP